MLRQLEIENIAVIEKASVSLHEGFHVFTGETGAGKSILIDAINAVLGGRIRKDLVRTGAAKATVQALFDELDPQVVQSAAQLGYPCDPGENSLLFMREFSPDGFRTMGRQVLFQQGSAGKSLYLRLLGDFHFSEMLEWNGRENGAQTAGN